jgi:hypothetical protein
LSPTISFPTHCRDRLDPGDLPAISRRSPGDLAPIVIDVSILSEGRYNVVGIKRINGTDVFGDNARKRFAHRTLLD